MSSFRMINEQGMALLRGGDAQRAFHHYQKALREVDRIPGITPSELAQLWNNFGLSCRYLEDLESARRAYETALKIHKKCEEPDLPEMAMTLSNLGRVSLARDDNNAAWEYLTEELTLWRGLLAEGSSKVDTVRVAWCLHNLAEVFCRRGGFEPAERNLLQALDLRRRVLPPDHDDIAENHRLLGDLYVAMRRERDAAEHYRAALPMFERMLGGDHPVTGEIRGRLRQLNSAPEAGTAEPSIPVDLRDAVRRATALGGQLYVLDKVSAIATDVLFENVRDARREGLDGYLPLREGGDDGRLRDAYLVYFYTREDPPRIAYQVRVKADAKPTFEAFDAPRAADPLVAMLARARRVAMAEMPATGQPINPVLLPGAADGEDGVIVYLLAATDKPGVAVFGRHFRAVVPESGAGVTYMMPLSNTALEIPMKGPNGETPAALTVTHLITDHPMETHVFTSLRTGLPVYVGTRRGVWYVAGSSITLVSDQPPKGMA